MNPRMLVVEDNESSLQAMVEYFATSGFEVDGATRLSDALALLAAHRYACVITDLDLGAQSGLGGLGVAQAVAERGGATPVIMLTAYGTRPVLERAREHGVVVVLSKPAALAEVARIARQFIRLRGLVA